MKARLTNVARTLDGEYQLTIQTRDPAAAEVWNDLHDKDIRFEPKQWRERRSLNANAYAWLLIDRLAEKLGITKKEVYREAIRDIGGVSDTCCVADKAVDKLVEGWSKHGTGWFTETMPSKLKGCTNVILYYGSSTYDVRQMNHLIDKLVQECKAQGIETATPQEIAAMNAAWGTEH